MTSQNLQLELDTTKWDKQLSTKLKISKDTSKIQLYNYGQERKQALSWD